MDMFNGWGPTIAQGAWTTVEVALVSSVFGIALGLLGAAACLSRFKAVRWLAEAYITAIRGIPQLLLILMVYFGSTVVLSRLLALVRPDAGMVEIPPYPAGVFALALIFGGYASEVFRGALTAIPRGQVEAGMAVGMGTLQIFFVIQCPQMLRLALPGLGNIWISTLKDTSLISIVGLSELMKASELATSDTRRALFFYLSAGAIYLTLTVLSSLVLHQLERRGARGERTA
ncbi:MULTISPECIES: ABC transporter permease [Variovorax]|uniref:ABC transporter permease n=1 Tax=Variovorax boronicumulans TaxID=436515 RepID=A0A1E7TXY9_9BURK|nr:ABC transporter permease [Variovorax boronicumulans]ATA52161.1 ABC transporter permease [Variovorax boronicumulans]MDP9876740.1 His/Glu/Gln/Arg/opine family amino acid ABC transporter permease subunit [Variovorax boronicumulans]MDP9913955.1 His/Glu/Gln/Arg/opine family amino acid ABC transporter permease subunit [Variovorax boronicumulans]MDP9920405.1 His/Glu/Gln/Arg/opine family amino acid ABC transporter permease subunit [Variovorax boronicumulans]MDP9922383.1 His/Glu/Gln/Arg/opine family